MFDFSPWLLVKFLLVQLVCNQRAKSSGVIAAKFNPARDG